jgi:hypothetical protein
MNNPIVPTLLLTASQQALFNEYGQMRSDMPILYAVYVQSPAYKIAATNDVEVDVEEIVQTAVVCPLAEKPNTFALRCPGSRKNTDGSIFVPATGNRKKNYTVVYSKDMKFAAFAGNAALAKRALKDTVKFSKNEAKAAKTPLFKAEIERDGINLLSAMYEDSVKKNAKMGEANGTVDLKAALQMEEIKEKFDFYERISIVADIDNIGFSFNFKAAKRPGAKVPSYAGARLPPAVLDGVASDAKVFYSQISLSGLDVPEEGIREKAVVAVSSVLNMLRQSKSKNVALFAEKISPVVVKAFSEVPMPGKNDCQTGWLGLDTRGNPYYTEKGTSPDPDKSFKAGVAVFDAMAKAANEVWPEYSVFRKGAVEGEYLIDWNAVVDINGKEAGETAEKELAVAKAKIKSIAGDSKSKFAIVKTSNGVQSFFGNPASVVNPEKGDGEARLAAALPEVAKDRPTSVFYMTPYAFIRDVVLPIVAKSAPKAERMQYEMMIKAMVPSMPNSALAVASWTEKDGSEKGVVRITANELKSLGVIFNTFTAATLANGAGESK